MSLDAKSFDFDVFESPNFKIENFNILGYDRRMLKTLNSRFWDPKTSNSKQGCFWMPKPQNQNFNILGHDPRMLKTLNLTF